MKKKSNTRDDNPHRLLLEGIPEAAAILASGGTILHANKALSKLLRRPLARITGVRLGDFVNADQRKVLNAMLKSRRASTSRTEVVLNTFGGASIPVLLSSRLMPVESGARMHLVILMDLRAIKEARLERREIERAALAERLRLFEVLETLPVYVILLSPDYHVPFANKFFRDRFGDSHGKRCFEFLFRRTEPCRNCESYTTMRTGKRHRWEWTGPDGRTYDIHDLPFRDWDGSPLIMEMGIDITEQKCAQEAQDRSSQYARSLIEAALDPLVTISPDGKITDVNEATIEATGVPRHELISTDFSRYFTEPEKARAGYRQVFADGSITDYPLTLRRKDGTLIDILYNASVYRDRGGNVLGVFAAARDVTERKRAEEELARHRDHLEELVKERTGKLAEVALQRQLALDAADMGWWHYDPISRVSSWDDRYKQIFGVMGYSRPNEEVLARLHPEDLPGVWASVEAALDPVNPQNYSVEYRINLPDGSMKWIEAHGIALFEGAGPNRRATSFIGTVADITERKRVVEALRAGEVRLQRANELLEAVTKGAEVLIAAVDKEFRYTYFNEPHHRELKRLTGKDTKIGMSLMEAMADMPDQRTVALDLWGRALKGETISQTTEFGDPGRYRRYYSTRHTPIRDADGAVIGAGEVTSDITEFMRAQEALREKEKDLNLAQAVARVGSWRLNAQRNEFVWSDENHRILGIPKGAPLTYEGFLSAVHPDDRDYVDERWKAALCGEPYDIEHRIIVDGEVRWVRDRAEVEFGAGGELVGAFGTTQDITERKRTEEEIERSRLWLERIAGTTPDIIFVLDIVNDRKVYANRSVIDLLGYAPEEFRGIGDILETAIEPEDRAQVVEFYRGMADALRGEVRVLTIRARHKDGRVLWLENRATPFSWDEEGNLVEVIAISHDITDLKLAHEVLQRDRETFERLVDERTAELIEIHHELDKAKRLSDIGMLASTVAHELRNPLGVIKTAAYNINRKKQGDALDKHLETINKKIDESNQIINNLLMYSRIKQPAYETVRIGDLLRESIESTRARNDGRPVTFLDKCGPVANATATLDPYQITEIMSNILENAAQAIPIESGGSVTVSAVTEDGMLHIRVSDTGVGIDPDVLPRVFEPFFTSKSKGTGLGLPLCKEYVALHNGSIDIESELGKGTTVTVILPLSPGIRPAAN